MSSSFEDGFAHQQAGRPAKAAQIYSHLLAENPNDSKSLHYMGLARMQMGDLANAERDLRRSIGIDGNCANAYCGLGAVLIRRNKLPDAVRAFEKGLELDPDHPDALNNIGVAFLRLKRPQHAIPFFKRLLSLRPDNVPALIKLANAQTMAGDVPQAAETLRRAVQIDGNSEDARLLLGDALESVGKFRQAVHQYRSVLRRSPKNNVALAKLINCKEADVGAEIIDLAEEAAADGQVGEVERARLNISLGHFYDRIAQYDQAFRKFKKANDWQSGRAPFESAGFSKAITRLIEVFSEENLASLAPGGSTSKRPIFIVGMPRSGTTLVEQILASHEDVAAGGELSTIMNLGRQINTYTPMRRNYPDGLLDLTQKQLSELATIYLQRLERVSNSAPRVTDKLPFNFMHLGLILSLFPNARIVHCVRNRLDTCLSCYFTSFAEELGFANKLDTLRSYYADYERLMDHWRKTLPGKIHEVQYEDLVEDTEVMVASLLEFCNLDWQAACVDFYKTDRGIRTPSRWQVRQPIYTKSVERWRNYEKHLMPLLSKPGSP